MKTESEYKTALVRAIRKDGHYARRIEDQYSVGFPDLIVVIRGLPPFFCEAKIIRNKTYFEPTERQYIELRRLSIGQTLPCLLGFDGGELYLHPLSKRAIIGQCLKKHDDETVVEFFQRYERFINE